MQKYTRMRIMAFDYGTKRIGIAVTDQLQIIASGLMTLHPDQIWDFLAIYTSEESVERFIVGMPVQMNGAPSDSAQHVKGFYRKLHKLYPHIPIEMMDERFTSKMAEASLISAGASSKQRRDKGLVDTIAATLILQSYMEKRTLQGF